ncbi:MAG: NAD(P)(+) transhydrogenase (Re/Si-specific) subunit beta [Acidobacteriota bacterium]|nr:NAD(P)(+) transhydrogenase (Re/Si-specific) subunit beta [Acidobacteriota bacterium]MDH3785630.1 NAD(P)(+) transhydrogenase (Re/Si-specific) subunit beta [Acidobacteriota bacterium]
MSSSLINIAYIFASILFILGLKGLTHPRTAVRGNLMGSAGMFIAVVVTLGNRDIIRWELILAGIVVGAAIGLVVARKIQMTAMPELVALFNGLGGAASVLVAGSALLLALRDGVTPMQMLIATAVSALIGGVTFFGSIIAFLKLRGTLYGSSPLFPGQQIFNAIIALGALGLGVMVVIEPTNMTYFWALVGAASLLGVLSVYPIGGADMPVVIALLNSYSGLAAAATGFVLSNNMLIVAGSLVGASGLILTQIMCKAMNRSLANVLFVGVGPTADGPSADEVYAGKIKSTSADEIAMLLDGVQRVVIVPGYGMAVAQAQHAVHTMAGLLEAAGAEVNYAVHPVAGRMPGHMNVLLAEANVDYGKLKDMDEANPAFEQTDVVIVIGANDVVNPAAREDPTSPIAGMPILDVDKARTVVMIKRSLSPGYAGIPNPLFALDNTLMFFNDGKQAIQEIITALKEA